MLDSVIKEEIKTSYQSLKTQLPQFIPRTAQKKLLAELAKTLAGDYNPSRRIFVAEAGTGVGKSLAYLLGSIPYAMQQNKKVVIATATVALQEQLRDKDIPLFKQIYPHECQVVLAKGRQRYCCAHKLAAAIAPQQSTEMAEQLTLFTTKPNRRDRELLKRLHHAWQERKWDGDKDSWPTTIPDSLWQAIQCDKHSCRARFSEHRQCPFSQARAKLANADVIITNLSLLMADLELGGGVILPAPEESIYIIDEAHHLPTVARDSLAASASLQGTAASLEKLNPFITNLMKIDELKSHQPRCTKLLESLNVVVTALNTTHQSVAQLPFNSEGSYRFEHGILPEIVAINARSLALHTSRAFTELDTLQDALIEARHDLALPPHLADTYLSVIANYLVRLENVSKLWQLFTKSLDAKYAPDARWVTLHPERKHDVIMHASPLEVGWRLETLLWSRAAGVGLFSATLRAVNQFDYFCRKAGLVATDGTQFLALPSPFDYANNATLHIPLTPFEPNHPEFTASLPTLLLRYLTGETASLVLFSSYWQMNEVAEQLQSSFDEKGWALQVQGKKSRAQILSEHAEHCQAGRVSILFGSSSFSEGLDLPGNLLTNLIITKIPFPVPTSPIEEAQAEYIEQRGGNPFLQIAVPEASKKLVQSVGRLLRKEQDTGRVVLLDRRIISKQYGKSLLNALPPFTRDIE